MRLAFVLSGGSGGAREPKMAVFLVASPPLRSKGGFVAGSRLPGDFLRFKISKPSSLCCPSSPASFARKCCLSSSMVGEKLTSVTEAFAIYDVMRSAKYMQDLKLI
ncbi:hypothetical protein BHE74_00045553 [Ensete ventricosum]|nr:hypothetical protein GW17_00042507 [Ensete ventricosum]RWW48371.1 hypothetical protein BHE74_00045553 [Ensete ventricosum]RZR85910.1 hypothetical protein BHM03_00012972 [Ensete ventricosum]